MSDKKNMVQTNDSMRIANSQRSNTPNTTTPAQTKPVFTPPAQNVTKSVEK